MTLDDVKEINLELYTAVFQQKLESSSAPLVLDSLPLPTVITLSVLCALLLIYQCYVHCYQSISAMCTVINLLVLGALLCKIL